MKNLFKYIGLISILLFSFYYTEKIGNMVMNNNSLVLEINNKTDEYNIEPVSAVIDDEYIVPGLNGYNVNVLKSYNNMKFLDAFNAYYLVYDKVTPDVSLENNKNKIIKYGNADKKSVAIILNNNEEILAYSKEKKINITRLITSDNVDRNSTYEQINNDYEDYSNLDTTLKNINKNTNICVINQSILSICQSKNKYLVEPSFTLTRYNLATIKSKIKSGSIILIEDDVSLADYKILIRQIYYQDLDIVSLSNLIKEERD